MPTTNASIYHCKRPEPHSGAKGPNSSDLTSPETDLAPGIGHNLRKRRNALKLSQSASAVLMGVSRAQYLRYESGSHVPRLYHAVKWSLYTGVPTSWLFHKTSYQSELEPVWAPNWQPVVTFVSLAPPQALSCLTNVLRELAGGRLQLPESVSLGQTLLPNCLTYYQLLGKNLKQYRESLGWTQSAAADFFQMTEATYRRYESPTDKTSISVVLMMRLQHLTGLDPVKLSITSPLHDYRLRQRQALAQLCPVMRSLNETQTEDVLHLTRYLMKVFRIPELPQ